MMVTEIKVQGDSSKSYTIKVGADGVVYCGCPSWRFSSLPPSQRTCKHMQHVQALIKA